MKVQIKIREQTFELLTFQRFAGSKLFGGCQDLINDCKIKDFNYRSINKESLTYKNITFPD